MEEWILVDVRGSMTLVPLSAVSRDVVDVYEKDVVYVKGLKENELTATEIDSIYNSASMKDRTFSEKIDFFVAVVESRYKDAEVKHLWSYNPDTGYFHDDEICNEGSKCLEFNEEFGVYNCDLTTAVWRETVNGQESIDLERNITDEEIIETEHCINIGCKEKNEHEYLLKVKGSDDEWLLEHTSDWVGVDATGELLSSKDVINYISDSFYFDELRGELLPHFSQEFINEMREKAFDEAEKENYKRSLPKLGNQKRSLLDAVNQNKETQTHEKTQTNKQEIDFSR